jgi:hypothetical protein
VTMAKKPKNGTVHGRSGLKATSVSAPSPGRKIEQVLPPTVPVFYVNSVNVDLSNWDVRIKLGQIQGGDSSAIQVADIAHVFMSHSHAKAFANILAGIAEKIDSLSLTATGKADDTTH